MFGLSLDPIDDDSVVDEDLPGNTKTEYAMQYKFDSDRLLIGANLKKPLKQPLPLTKNKYPEPVPTSGKLTQVD
jgi:hypothetical protein